MAAERARIQAHSVTPSKSVLSIGQVLAKLLPEFPDLTHSKLRFLEDQGLISPERTVSGYRKFSNDDIERIRFILTLQRDNYLPLKVIKKHLNDLDRGIEPEFDVPSLTDSQHIIYPTASLSRKELVEESGATTMLFQEAVSYGLLPAAQHFGDDSVRMLKSLVELQKYGIEPRHLRGYRAAMDREVGLIEVALLPLSRGKDATSKVKAAEVAKDLASHLDTVRSTLVKNGIQKLNNP